jgi:hypothetical protein
MGRKKTITLKEAAKLVINSRRTAELFIERYIEKHQSTREAAIERLRELGIEPSQLPE